MSNKILVVEANAEMCQKIISILKLGQYDVLVSNTGKAGLEQVQENHPDLILCDAAAPEVDGHRVLHTLRKDPITANIPFIFLSVRNELRDFRAGMNLGADDYITKPFDSLELLNVIELRLKKSEQIKTMYQNIPANIDYFFKAKSLHEFQKLSANHKSRTYQRKALVFAEGRPTKYVYFIERGLVKTFKSTTDGKELITGLHRSGSFFGFVPLLEGKLNSEGAIVLKESQIHMIPQEDFLKLIYSNREIARHFISMLARNLCETENTLLELAYQSVRQRVATVLIKLSDSSTPDQSITLARKDLSALVGTTTESLNRVVIDFKNEGLIEIDRKGLRIVQHYKLEKTRCC